MTLTAPPLPVAPAASKAAPSASPQAPQQRLMGLIEAARLIASGQPCCVAGDPSLLTQLPRGTWIGGSTAWFVEAGGGQCRRDQLFVTTWPRWPAGSTSGAPQVVRHDAHSLRGLCEEAPPHGLTVLLLPAFSRVHEAFAQEAPDYPGMYLNPLVGWIAGVHADQGPQARPGVLHGPSGEWLEDAAVALHLPLPEGVHAHVDIINLWQAGDGPVLEFEAGGFGARHARIDGQRRPLAAWLREQGAAGHGPLVADYCGAAINVSLREVPVPDAQDEAPEVRFFAPVFPGVAYRLARPVQDGPAAFARELAQRPLPAPPSFSCHCILEFAPAGSTVAMGPSPGDFPGPVAFGEIGYQLLNQTLVYLSLVGEA